MERTDELKERIRQQPLNDRLEESRRRIGDMCSKGRCPKMTIPVQHDDDDFYINTTLADAQATIAALQDERDGWVRSREHYYQLWMRATDERDEMRKERDDFESQLTQRTAELEAAKREVDAWKASQECSEKAYMALVNQIPAERFDYDPVNVALLDGAKEQEIIGRKQIADLQGLLKWTDENREQWRKLCQEAQSQLTQHTSELEAANHAASTHQALWREACDQRDELHAELERVRADNKALDEWRADVTVSLQRPGGAFFVDVPQHIKDLVKERDDLRTLLLALPKVEGEIEIKRCEGLWYVWVILPYGSQVMCGRFRSQLEAESYAAIVKHRQVMEG